MNNLEIFEAEYPQQVNAITFQSGYHEDIMKLGPTQLVYACE